MAEPVPAGDVRRALVTSARACALAVAELTARPGDVAALEMARTALETLESVAEMAQGWRVDEAVVEAMCARAVEQDRASRRRGGRLRRVVLPVR